MGEDMKIRFMRAVIAIAAITALGQADSRSSRWRRFDAYAMLALATLAALTALTFGMIDAAGLGTPNASTLCISAAAVLTCLWCGRLAHPPVKLRFLREPRFLAGAGNALRGHRGVILTYLSHNFITASATTSSCAFSPPAMQPWDKAHEHLARHQVPSEYRGMPANVSRSSAHTTIAMIAGTAASLPGLTQRLSPSVT
jgi:hypothetical protein